MESGDADCISCNRVCRYDRQRAALAVNTAMEMGHAIQPAWWLYCYPYLLMIPAAVAFFAKFTKKGDKNNDK